MTRFKLHFMALTHSFFLIWDGEKASQMSLKKILWKNSDRSYQFTVPPVPIPVSISQCRPRSGASISTLRWLQATRGQDDRHIAEQSNCLPNTYAWRQWVPENDALPELEHFHNAKSSMTGHETCVTEPWPECAILSETFLSKVPTEKKPQQSVGQRNWNRNRITSYRKTT